MTENGISLTYADAASPYKNLSIYFNVPESGYYELVTTREKSAGWYRVYLDSGNVGSTGSTTVYNGGASFLKKGVHHLRYQMISGTQNELFQAVSGAAAARTGGF